MRRAAACPPPNLPGSPAAAPVSSGTSSPPGSSRSNSPRPSRPHPDRPTGGFPVRRSLPTSRWRRGGWSSSVEAGSLRGDGARRRHRVGQDRDLFRRARRSARRRAAGLVLLPEIALGAQWLGRFRERFGALPAQWHSDMIASRAPRHLAGRRRRPGAGRRRRPLGAVPALPRARPDHRRRGARPLLQAGGRGLLPGPRHGGAARLAGRHPDHPGLGDPVARNGRQCRARALPARRFAAPPRGGRAARRASRRSAPRADRARPVPRRRRWSRELAATFDAGEQALLFLNRRGYAPLTLCRACGHRFQCPSCTAWLVEHRFTGRLLVPPLRPCRAGAGVLPGMPRGRCAGAVRAGGRAPARGGDRAVSGGARGADGQRSAVRPARRGRARRRR